MSSKKEEKELKYIFFMNLLELVECKKLVLEKADMESIKYAR